MGGTEPQLDDADADDQDQEPSDGEFESEGRQRSNSATHMLKMLKNKLSAQEISTNEQFISATFLFLNETLFRFIGIISVIKSVTLTSDVVKCDQSLYRKIFQNPLFDTLNECMRFVLVNKTNYAATQLNGLSGGNSTANTQFRRRGITPSDTPDNVQEQAGSMSSAGIRSQQPTRCGTGESNFSQKLIEVRRLFMELLPELSPQQP